ncbi:MAG: hypothetical protein ACI9R8_000412 [Candidatus Paceibacteria bacterium]|jgi:hypothetical protein
MGKWAWLAWRLIVLVGLNLGLNGNAGCPDLVNGNAGCPDLELPSQSCSALCALCKSQFYLQIASHIIVGDNLKVQFS